MPKLAADSSVAVDTEMEEFAGLACKLLVNERAATCDIVIPHAARRRVRVDFSGGARRAQVTHPPTGRALSPSPPTPTEPQRDDHL